MTRVLSNKILPEGAANNFINNAGYQAEITAEEEELILLRRLRHLLQLHNAEYFTTEDFYTLRKKLLPKHLIGYGLITLDKWQREGKIVLAKNSRTNLYHLINHGT